MSATVYPSSGVFTGILSVTNVKTDYGAVGDGTTADHVALQDALTAVGATTYGGIVYLPPGVYLVNKYLLIPSNVTLLGAGKFLTTIKAGGSLRSAGGTAPGGGGYSVLQATGTTRQNIAIQDLTVDGNESADRAALAASGVRLNSFLIDMRTVTGLRIERVATRNSWTYNIAVLDSTQFIVSECDVRDPGTTGTYSQLDGIHIWGSNRGQIVNNYVDNGVGGDADDAMVAHVFPGGNACYDLVFANNVCRGGANGNGMQLAGASGGAIRDITISGNKFWGCISGLRVNFFSASSNQPIRSVAITGNSFRDGTTSPPIRLSATNDGQWEDITISNNVIDGYGTSASQFTYGIVAEGGNSSGEVTIVGNTLRNGYSRGIVIDGVRDYIVGQNVVDMKAAQNDPLAIILTGGSRDGVVSGNVLTGRSGVNGLGIYMDSPTSPVATNQMIIGNRSRSFGTGILITNGSGANPTNTQVLGNNTQGNGTGTAFGTATVTSANNL